MTIFSNDGFLISSDPFAKVLYRNLIVVAYIEHFICSNHSTGSHMKLYSQDKSVVSLAQGFMLTNSYTGCCQVSVRGSFRHLIYLILLNPVYISHEQAPNSKLTKYSTTGRWAQRDCILSLLFLFLDDGLCHSLSSPLQFPRLRKA